MEKSTAAFVIASEQNDIRELSLDETLLVGAAGCTEEFPVIPR